MASDSSSISGEAGSHTESHFWAIYQYGLSYKLRVIVCGGDGRGGVYSQGQQKMKPFDLSGLYPFTSKELTLSIAFKSSKDRFVAFKIFFKRILVTNWFWIRCYRLSL